MAIAIIHLAVAKKVLDKIKVKNEKDYFLGSIAPDIAKQIGISKEISHFNLNSIDKTPTLKLFIKRYPYFNHNSFNLGYYTHLYTDKVWLEEFVPSITQNDYIKLLDGTIMKTNKQEFLSLLYSDYTNLSIDIIDNYNLDLSLFYEDFIIPETNLTEIPIEKLDILINKMSIIIENAKSGNNYILDTIPIFNFIDDVAERIIKELKNY